MKTLTEYFIDGLRSTRLYEMAKNQSDCEDIVRSECTNILENLFLLNYFEISKLPTRNIAHWKDELETSITNAGKFKVKQDNSTNRRSRIIERVFNEEDMRDYDMVYKTIIRKVYKEKETQHNTNNNSESWIDEAIIATINMMDDIEALIVEHSFIETMKWTDKKFKD